MNNQVRLHPAVPDDLYRTMTWLDHQLPGLGERYGMAVTQTLENLVVMPGKGSIKRFGKSRNIEIRSWPIQEFHKYLIFYHMIDSGIQVITITHGARRLRRILGERR